MLFNKFIIGITLAIVYAITIKKSKIKLLYSIIFNLCTIELLYFSYKNKSYNDSTCIYYITLSLTKLILSKYLLKNVKISNIKLEKLLIITSLNDVFQELIGSKLGKNKIKIISPNKTIEGYLGGYLLSILVGKKIFGNNLISSSKYYILNVIGDLFFSYVKRLHGVKDYSNILLSHGGFLDRYDSIILPILFELLNKKYKG